MIETTPRDAVPPLVAKTGRTLTKDDDLRLIRSDHGSGIAYFTVPLNLPVGFACRIEQGTDAALHVKAQPGVFLHREVTTANRNDSVVVLVTAENHVFTLYVPKGESDGNLRYAVV